MKRLVFLLIGLFVGGALGTQVVSTSAQSDVCEIEATPEVAEVVTSGQRLLGQADYEAIPDGPARLTTTQITLAPGAATQPFVNAGPVLIVVQEGTVTLTADEALIGAPPEPTLGGIEVETTLVEPTQADAVGVTKGEQISLGEGVNAQLSNMGAESVRLLLIVVAPVGS